MTRRFLAILVFVASIWIRNNLQQPQASLTISFQWMEIFNAPFQLAQFASDLRHYTYHYVAGCLLTAWLLLIVSYLWQSGRPSKVWHYFKTPWFCPLISFIFAITTRTFGLHNFVAITDEAGHVFQAQIYLTGYMTALSPPSQDHFVHPALQLYQGHWSGMAAPGWPLLLALGYLVHLPDLVSPLILMLTVFLMQELSRRWHGDEAAAWTGVLALGSPALLLYGSVNFSHLPTALWALAALNCLEKVKPGIIKWSFAAGLFLGLMISTRFVDGAILCAIIFIWRVILPGSHYSKPSLGQVLILMAGISLGLAPLLAQNQANTGNMLVSNYQASGVTHYFLATSMPVRIHLAFLALCRHLWWSSPFLLELIFIACLHKDNRVYFFIFNLFGIALIYAHPDMIGMGSRYLFPSFIMLTVVAGQQCRLLAEQHYGRAQDLITAYLLFLCLTAYPNYIRSVSNLYSSVFIRDSWIDQVIGPDGIGILRYDPLNLGMSFTRNRPDLRGPIRVISLGPEQDALLAQALPQRQIAYLDYNQMEQRLELVAYDHSRDDFTRLCGGAHYANEVNKPDLALKLWEKIPTSSPWKHAALSNSIKLLRRLGRHQQADLTEAGLSHP